MCPDGRKPATTRPGPKLRQKTPCRTWSSTWNDHPLAPFGSRPVGEMEVGRVGSHWAALHRWSERAALGALSPSIRGRQMTKSPANIRIGTAGWTIPTDAQPAFPKAGTHLERYSAVFDGVEINSSFHRHHRTSTYQRWAASVPDHFRFSVKVPKEITHTSRLTDSEPLLDSFLAEVSGLGHKLGPLLFQLPPSFAFEPRTAQRFLTELRNRISGPVTCEPRHPSWFAPEPESLFATFTIARTAADPPPVPGATQPGGWHGLRYARMHGSPRIYHSTYGDEAIRSVVDALCADEGENAERWYIFDNTASGAATLNALTAVSLVGAR